jgi:hydroxypyruvate reductase
VHAVLRQHLGAMVSSALAAIDARRLTLRALQSLSQEFAPGTGVRVVAIGKAATGMARAASEFLGDRLRAGVVTSTEAGAFASPWQVFRASHPLPDSGSEAAGRAALVLASEAGAAGDVLLVCLSGGASAMSCVPADGLTLADKRAANAALLAAGLDIGSMNVVRRHLSAIKGGQLAARARRSITLAISDVIAPVEDDPLTIGSGPTVADHSTFADALAVIDRAGIRERMPPAAMAHLEAGAAGSVHGPVAPGDPRLQGHGYWVIGSRHDAMRGAAAAARQIGYHAHVFDQPLAGEARHAGRPFLDAARSLARPCCVIASGETTVRVVGKGTGGRNQELVVGALEPLAALAPAALASVGTDGVDGPTDAAGAFADSAAWDALGQDAAAICAQALDANDTYPLVEGLDGLIKTGPTGTNVGDLQLLLLP